MDDKKLFVVNLRPIQLKIEDILAFKDRVENIECNIKVSDEERDPLLKPQ
jgi:hypothetical protein